MNATSISLFAASSSARLVVILVTLLVLLGVAMAALTVWLIASTRPDREALARLEVMGQRRWRSATIYARRRYLDEARPRPAASRGDAEDDLIVDADVDADSDVDADASAADEAIESNGDSTPERGIGIIDIRSVAIDDDGLATNGSAGGVDAGDDRAGGGDDREPGEGEGKLTH